MPSRQTWLFFSLSPLVALTAGKRLLSLLATVCSHTHAHTAHTLASNPPKTHPSPINTCRKITWLCSTQTAQAHSCQFTKNKLSTRGHITGIYTMTWKRWAVCISPKQLLTSAMSMIGQLKHVIAHFRFSAKLPHFCMYKGEEHSSKTIVSVKTLPLCHMIICSHHLLTRKWFSSPWIH